MTSSLQTSVEIEPTISNTMTTTNTTMPVVGSMRNAPRVGADFKLVDLDDEEENVQPLPVPTDREVDGRCREDVMRGYITCGLLQKLLHQLQQAQDVLVHAQKNEQTAKTIAQLNEEIDVLKRKIRAEETQAEEMTDDLTIIVNASQEKSDNIKQETEKLVKFCDHFRSRAFEDTYQGERELLQMDHDFKTSCQLTAFLEARIEAEKTKKYRLLVLLEAGADENENESEA